MSLGYRLKVLGILTFAVVGAMAAWSTLRWRSHAAERGAWAEMTEGIAAGEARLDSLETAIALLEDSAAADRASLAAMEERIGFYGRRARGDALSTPQYRAYSETVARHTALVDRHNARVAEAGRLHGERVALVGSHNRLVERANALQRRATQEGFVLPEPPP